MSRAVAEVLLAALAVWPANSAAAQTTIWEKVRVPGAGSGLSLAGDWDADGVLDLALGGLASTTWEIEIVRGVDGSHVTSLMGNRPTEIAGSRMLCPGDLDGDGFDDLVTGGMIGTTVRDFFVRAYSSGTGQVLYETPGLHSFDGFGDALAALDDLNGDGAPEIVVGARYYSVPGQGDLGAAFVLDGATGRILYSVLGSVPFAAFGKSVADLDDLDGDGFRDFLVGEFGDGQYPGGASIFSSLSGALLRTHSGSHPGQAFGCAVARWDDQDGDGIDDYLVGALGDNTVGYFEGAVYGFASSDGRLLLSLFPDPVHSTGEFFGQDLDGGRDLDGDGRNDFVVSFISNVNGYDCGGVEAYSASGTLLFGRYGHQEREHFGSLSSGSRLVPDFNGDGRAEILTQTLELSQGTIIGGRALLISGWDDIPVLRSPSHVAGAWEEIQVSNSVPASTVRVGASTGPGPTATPWGLVALSPPIRLLPPIPIGSTGFGSIQLQLPLAIRDLNVYLHALEVTPTGPGRLSQPLWIVVQ